MMNSSDTGNTNNQTAYNRTDCLKRLYKAHDIIADITTRVDKLYQSASSISPLIDDMPKGQGSKSSKFENIICEIADLKTYAESLLIQRAKFDVFLCTLDSNDVKVLSMRCEHGMSWKEIAGELRVSPTTAKDVFRRIASKAETSGCIRPIPSDSVRK